MGRTAEATLEGEERAIGSEHRTDTRAQPISDMARVQPNQLRQLCEVPAVSIEIRLIVAIRADAPLS